MYTISNTFFEKPVDLTKPLCQKINSHLASTLVFDISGIEIYDAENNPKFLNVLVKKLKKLIKTFPILMSIKMAYNFNAFLHFFQ